MNFLMVLSRLDPKHKERCFDEIISTLEKGGKGPNSIRYHLMEGMWNKITEDSARNDSALITIEVQKRLKIAMHDYFLPFTSPPPPFLSDVWDT